MTLDWTPVVVAVIAATPGAAAAFFSQRNGRQLRTPNGETVGTMVTEAHGAAAEAKDAARTADAIVRRTLGERKSDAKLREQAPGKKRAADDD